VHALGTEATEAFESSRSRLAAFGREALAPLRDSPLVGPLAERLRERLAALDAE
jgi:hypothetical protein